ncbi:MAG: arginine decarboxylase, partial [Spartobacteria bacterium]
MTQPSFSIQDAADLYSIDRWGGGYFGINDAGHVVVRPKRNGETIDLMEVVAEARAHKLAFPLVVRFHDLLRDRVETINKAFSGAIAEANYTAPYRGVFPIKVNQLREVVE